MQIEQDPKQLSSETARWLEERQRPGNWVAIGLQDEIPSDMTGWNVTVLHIFQIAFTPEIDRRLKEGTIDNSFVLRAAQMIQPPEGPKIIRFNDEVRGIPLIKLDRAVEAGEPVFASDLRNLVSFDVEESELDCGHFTMFWHGSGWSISFDLRSGRAKSAQMVESARQFLGTAQYAAAKGHAGPSVDNLFSACELLSKAQLILHRSHAAKAKSHRAVSSALNAWGRLGNVDRAFLTLFNRISNSRSAARYDAAAQVALPSDADFDIVGSELSRLEKAVAHRTKEQIESNEAASEF